MHLWIKAYEAPGRFHRYCFITHINYNNIVAITYPFKELLYRYVIVTLSLPYPGRREQFNRETTRCLSKTGLTINNAQSKLFKPGNPSAAAPVNIVYKH